MDEQVNKGAGRRPKIGLVLEDGGLRGIFTAGVLDILMDHSFRPEYLKVSDAQSQIERLEAEGRIFVIRPSEPLALSRLEKDHAKIQAAYDMGCRVAKALWLTLESYLKQ